MTKTRAATTPRPPASSATKRVTLDLEIEAPLESLVIAAGARLGVEVRARSGSPRLLLEDGETLAHQLRTEVLSVAQSPLDLASGASARTMRCLAGVVGNATAKSSAIVREESDGRLTLVLRDRLPVDLGEAPEALRAIRAARVRQAIAPQQTEFELPPEAEARARAITFGPARTLSDPSSRRVLEAFGIACAPWRLAETAARAAAHARAIGYPVDLRIASPDISAIDDPRFAVTELRTPGEVREGFRTLTREVRRLAPEARTLGATITKHLPGAPTLRFSLLRGNGRSDLVRIELDDPIGKKLSRPLLASAPVDLDGAARLIDGFDGRDVLPGPDTILGRALLDLLVRLSRAAIVLADTLTGAEIAPLVPDGDGWCALGARVSVRGIAEG